MSDWRTKQINQLGRVVTGKTPPKVRSDYFDGSELFVSPKDFDWNGGYVERTQTTITEQALRAFRNQVIPRNAVLFTSISFGFGKIAIASRRLLTNQQINSVIANEDHNFRFIYYLLRAYTPVIFSYNSGIDTPIVPKSVFEKIEVKCPEFELQRKIAAILTAYDDLIATNNRRIAILEKVAEEIFREWFVRMRFPGHQDTHFIKGFPEKWPLQRFTDLVEINPRDKVDKADFVPYVGMESLSATSMYFISHESRKGAAGSKFRNRDTLLPRITPCLENGKRGFVSFLEDQQIGIGSTEFIVLREKVLPPEYIYLLSCNPSFRQHAELSMTGASGRQRVKDDCFSYFFVATPPENIRYHFSEITRPIFQSISVYAKQNAILSKTRDLLLPRLISGKLSVADLDIQFPPSMREEIEGVDQKEQELRGEPQPPAISQEGSRP